MVAHRRVHALVNVPVPRIHNQTIVRLLRCGLDKARRLSVAIKLTFASDGILIARRTNMFLGVVLELQDG